MEIAFGILVGLVILIILVAVHEFGHAFAALKNGVGVDEFGIGFPPRAWGKKLKNGVLFTLNWLPLGGFVKLQGEYDAADKKGDYGAASYFQKTQILLAGVAVNWLVAAIILSILAAIGLPKVLPDQFYVKSDTTVEKSLVKAVQVTSGSPAERAGIKPGDVIFSIENEPVTSPEQLAEKTKEYRGQSIQLLYERNGTQSAAEVKLNEETTATSGYLGVKPGQSEVIKAGWSAPVTGVVTTAQFSWMTLVGIKDLIVNTSTGVVQRFSTDEATREQAKENLAESAANVAGPIGILAVIFPAAAQAGFVNLLFLTAIISLTLAVMNILPIPALDGGRWTIMTIFRLIGRPLTKEIEEQIQSIGFMVLLALIIVITITDIGKLF